MSTKSLGLGLSLRLNLTSQSKAFLIHLYNLITDLRHHIKTQIQLPQHQPIITHKTLKSSPTYPDTRFISEHIKHEIKKLTAFYQISSPTPSQSKSYPPPVTIKLYAKPSKSQSAIHTMLKKLYITVLTLKALTKNTLPIHLTIYLTSSKKLLPLHATAPLSPNDVNSGSTLTSTPTMNGIVTIWREEELLRVTVHETLHALKSDYALYTSPLLDNLALKTFPFLPADNNVNINEAYNELNSCIISAALSKHSTSVSKFLKNLEYERLYSIKLAAKILRYQYELTNTPQIASQTSKMPPFHQKSSIFSYYILKTAMLYNLNTYIKFVITQFPANFYPIFSQNLELNAKFFTQVIHPSYKMFLPTLKKLAKSSKLKAKTQSERSLKMTITSQL